MTDIEKNCEEGEWQDTDFLTFDDDTNNKIPVVETKDQKEEEQEEQKGDKSNTETSSGMSSKKRPRYNEPTPRPTPTSLTSVSELPPWMDKPHSDKYHRNVPRLVALHDEMVSFATLMAPQPDELKLRQDLVEKVTKLVQEIFQGRECSVHVFGSQATGLLLPTSDIDFVVMLPEVPKEVDEKADDKKNAESNDSKKKKKSKKSGEKKELSEKQLEVKEMDEYNVEEVDSHLSPLAQLGQALRTHQDWSDQLSYLEVVEKTRVPIIKFTHGPTNLAVDICFNQEAGTLAADLMKRFLDAMPPLKPLTFVLKYFMAARGLNEPYSGGCGSFMLQMMIVSFLQHRERHAYNNQDRAREGTANTMNLGSMLLEFFELYGMDFNYLTTGISVRSDGFYFPKGAKGKKEFFHQPSRPFSLSIENPFDITADVGKASFRMQLIAKSFETAMRVLLSHTAEPFVPTESILASILPPTEEMFKRATMLKVLNIEGKLNKNKSNGGGGNANKSRKRRKTSESSMETSDSD
jgi:non-canonical poly(A) RNA polymerase PAPD5/7